MATFRGALQEVGDALDQEVAVLEVGEEEGHLVLGADGHGAGQDAAAVCLLHNGYLESRMEGREESQRRVEERWGGRR
jgi:hypothetical protein